MLFDRIGLGVDYMRRAAHSTFTLESHLNFLRELGAGDSTRFSFQLIEHDRKRMHYFGRMFHANENYLAATMEWLSIHVSLETRRSAEMGPALRATLGEVAAAHRALARPAEAGRVIGLRQGKARVRADRTPAKGWTRAALSGGVLAGVWLAAAPGDGGVHGPCGTRRRLAALLFRGAQPQRGQPYRRQPCATRAFTEAT